MKRLSNGITLRARIFIGMIVILIISSILMAGLTTYHFSNENEEYHKERLKRKEEAIRASIDYFLKQDTDVQKADSLVRVFDTKICELADINNMDINIYNRSGHLLITSRPYLFDNRILEDTLNPRILDSLNAGIDRYVEEMHKDTLHYLNTFGYLRNELGEPIGIINVPYLQDDSFHKKELRAFLSSLAQVYILLFIGAAIIAYFISNYITRSLREISARIEGLKIDGKNEPLHWPREDEIGDVIREYNRKVEELENSAELLMKSEREAAWKKMARQVAHEIKNPLTPMKLSLQQLERSMDKDDPNFDDKMKKFIRSMISQIDTLANIAGTFSSFASMPHPKKEFFNLDEVLFSSVDLYDPNIVKCTSEDASKIRVAADREQLVRVMNNLINNALDATREKDHPEVKIRVEQADGMVRITVSDNGVGIPDEDQERIFEPNFTTKSSGTGLGLAMVRTIIENMGGSISVHSESGSGAQFSFTIPIADE